jgi:SMC interacting uncharacterized protein involved in chromosome segregation
MSTVLELYEKLKPKLGEEETRALLEFVESSVQRGAANKEDLLRAEAGLREEINRVEAGLREEINRVEAGLREEINRAEAGLREKINQVRVEFKEEINQARVEFREEIGQLEQKIEAVKADFIKWAFGFWVGTVAILSGIILAIVRAFAGK